MTNSGQCAADRGLDLGERAGAAAGQQHHDRLAMRELRGEGREQRRLAAPLVAVGEDVVRVVRRERRAGLAVVLDLAGGRDADQQRHAVRVGAALGSEQRHDAGVGPAIHDRGAGRAHRLAQRGAQCLARHRQLRLAQVVGAAGDDDHGPRRPRRDPGAREQVARMLALALDDDRLVARWSEGHGAIIHHARPGGKARNAPPGRRRGSQKKIFTVRVPYPGSSHV